MLKVFVPLSVLLLVAGCSSGDSSSPAVSDGSEGTPSAATLDVDYVPESMVKMFEENSVFSIFAELVSLTDLAPLFEADGEITVFAPANAAFDELPEGTLDKLKDPKNREILTRLISNHLLDGKVTELQITSGTLVMKSGEEVAVEVGSQVGYLMNIKMNGISVLVGDLYAGKSVAHVLGGLLVPSDLDLESL